MTREEFIQPEIKCEFQIDSARKKLWYCELEIMEVLEHICQKYNLNYFLLGGSAIGAVRHQGFIPWDDDIDIGMLRSDFDVLLEKLPTELGDRFYFEYGVLAENHVSILLRIRDPQTTGIVADEFIHNRGGGIYVEIYPYDKVPKNKLLWKLQWLISSHLSFMMCTKEDGQPYSGRLKFLHEISKHIPTSVLWNLYDKNCRAYNKSQSMLINCPATPQYVKNRPHSPMNELTDIIHIPFEYLSLRIPRDYDSYIRKEYSNYMELPPVEERGLVHDKTIYYNADIPYTSEQAKTEAHYYFNC